MNNIGFLDQFCLVEVEVAHEERLMNKFVALVGLLGLLSCRTYTFQEVERPNIGFVLLGCVFVRDFIDALGFLEVQWLGKRILPVCHFFVAFAMSI